MKHTFKKGLELQHTLLGVCLLGFKIRAYEHHMIPGKS